MANILARQRQLVGSTLDWATNDLVIGDGEIAVERITNTEVKLKVGTGTLKFSVLPYCTGQVPIGAVLTSQLVSVGGVASAKGVVQLNSLGQIDASMLSVSGGLAFIGSLDLTGAPPASVTRGDYGLAKADATVGAGWPGLTGTTVKRNDLILFDGTDWHASAQDINLASYLPITGGALTGPLGLPAQTGTGSTAPTASQAISKAYLDLALALKADLTALTTLAARVTQLEADILTYLPLAGGALTGALTSSSTIHATGEISSTADITAFKP